MSKDWKAKGVTDRYFGKLESLLSIADQVRAMDSRMEIQMLVCLLYVARHEDEYGSAGMPMSKIAEALGLAQSSTSRNAINDPEDFSTFVVPKKFLHVDFNKFSKTSNEVEELKNILRKVPKYSSLNYGMTAVDTIKRIYTKTLPKFLGSKTEIQILSPQVRGTLGTSNLNKVIQESVNPPAPGKKTIQIGERLFREGDRIIQTKNNYDLGVFNGDIGKILNIDATEGQCLVLYKAGEASKEVLYEKGDITQMSLAYAITVHKSQGSEFEAVIIPVSTQHFKMLFRNLIYTGLTRAKKRLIFVGSRKALTMAAKQVDSSKRQTALTFLVDNNFSNHLI